MNNEYICNTTLLQNTSDHYKVSCYPRHEFEAPKRPEEGIIECVASEKYGVSFLIFVLIFHIPRNDTIKTKFKLN